MIEIQFDASLQDPKTLKAVRLAKERQAEMREKYWIVKFSESTDPDLFKLLDLVGFLDKTSMAIEEAPDYGVDKDPFDVGERAFELGSTLVHLNLIDAAEYFVKKGLEVFKEDFLLLEVLAQVEIARGNYPAALKYIERVMDQGEAAEIIEEDERFAALRSLPGFKKLIGKI